MKEKVGMSIYEKVLLWIIISCNGIIISYAHNKIETFFLVVGICLTLMSPYNAIKTVEAHFRNLENINKSSLISIICFLIGFSMSGIAIFFISNSLLSYVWWMLYHVLILFITIPLLLIDKLIKYEK